MKHHRSIASIFALRHLASRDDIAKQKHQENTAIPADFSFTGIPGLSNELQSKLTQVKPETIGQAQRIPGMTPAAISLLLIQLKKRRRAA